MKFRLPEAIGNTTHFTWGPVVAIHRVPALDINIVEYHPGTYDDEGHSTRGYEKEKVEFHLHDTCYSFNTLSQAIIHGIAKYHKSDDHFARAACKLIVPTEE